MAIIKSHTIVVFDKEVSYESAYHKVLSLNATNENITVNVLVYNNDTKKHVIDSVTYTFDDINIIEPNLIQAGYMIIKDLPQYDGAIDVFEEGQPIS